MSVINSLLRAGICAGVSVSLLVALGCNQIKEQKVDEDPNTAQPPAKRSTELQPGSVYKASAADQQASLHQASATPAPNPLAEIELKLLNEAERAFRARKYTTPTYDNAYDKFQSVLLLNPESGQARAGLQAILLRYAGLIREALNEGRISSAQRYISQVEAYYPANSLLMDLKKQTLAARKKVMRRPAPVVQPPDLDAEEFVLSTKQLSGKSPKIINLLATIGSRVKETDESVMIYARNDREGRWIYSQLKQAATGYRVRGDIRISRKPKIQLLPPL